MSRNEIGSGETVISSDPITNFIAERHPRQGGKFRSISIMTAARLLLAGSALAGSAGVPASIAGADDPEITAAAFDLSKIKYLHGDPTRETTFLLYGQDVGERRLKEVTEKALFVISPTDEKEIKDRVSVVTPDSSLITRPNCREDDQKCDDAAVKKTVDAVRAATGIVPDAILIVVNGTFPNRDNGYGGINFRFRPRSMYDYAKVVIPFNTEINAGLYGASIAHELYGHLILGEPHRGGDLMVDASLYPYFNDYHKQLLRNEMALGKQRFGRPEEAGFRILNKGWVQNAQGVYVLQDMGLNVAITSPFAESQAYTTITPANNDGPDFKENIGVTRIIASWADGRNFKDPVLGQGPYIFLPGVTYEYRVKHPPIPTWSDKPAVPVPDTVFKFRTRPTSINTISRKGFNGTSLVWQNTDTAVWNMRVQVSGDPAFNQDPKTATSYVYDNQIHAGLTDPLNSYRLPDSLPPGTHYWRVQPMRQADAEDTGWSPTWQFTKVASNKEILTPTRYLLNPSGLPILGEAMFAKPVLDFGFVQDAKRNNQKYRQAKDEARVAKEEYAREESFANYAQAIVDAVSGRGSTVRVGDYTVNIPAVR